MPKHSFSNISQETIEKLNQTSAALATSSLNAQRERIKQDSPYSEKINQAFSGYEEFSYLASLDLVEADVTRRSLIRDIDFNLYITSKQHTNYELMQQGLAPYAKDEQNSYIVLHHIGQTEGAPFAELTWTEHTQYGNAKMLHNSKEESWRRDLEKDRKYMAEKSAYWKKRAKHEVTIYEKKGKNIIAHSKMRYDEHAREMQDAIECLFSECSVSDLNYISNLAQSYILTKEIGARTVEEFIFGLNNESDSNIKCPACGGKDISLYGSYQTDKETKRKYKCKACGKVFSAFYNTIIQGCTLSLFEWLRFIDCLYNGYSIKKTAHLCNISEVTAFQNRIRLFYALSHIEEQVVLQGSIAMDEKYIPISYKGNRSQQENFSMPRTPHKRGQENHTPGTSKNQACVVCALDEYGNSVAKVAGKGGPTAGKIDFAVSKHIDAGAVKMIYSDKSAAIRKFALSNGYPIQQECLKKPNYKNGTAHETVRQIQRVNSYHSRLEKFLGSFNGISSDLLQGYVSLFAWKERYRDKSLIEAYKELLSVMVAPNLYKPFEHLALERVEFNSSLSERITTANYFRDKKSKEKAEQIYALYAKGVSQTQIAKQFGCSKQAVNLRIKQIRQLGLAYKTEEDLARSNINRVFKEFELKKLEKYKHYSDIWLEMLETKERWSGTSNDFFDEMQKKYNISRQTVKNNLAHAKRIRNLREVFYINEQYNHFTLQEVFVAVYQRYNELKSTQPGLPRVRYYSILADEYKYKNSMIQAIVTGMENNSIDWEGKSKIKIPMAQTLNRDRAVFVDCLKWTGTKAGFLKYAAEKYHISSRTVVEILMLNCMADPNRYEISKLD